MSAAGRWRYAPLAVTGLVHLAACVWCTGGWWDPRFRLGDLRYSLVAYDEIRTFLLFPVHLALLTVWLATRSSLVRSLPWALALLAVYLAWQFWLASQIDYVNMLAFLPLGMLFFCGTRWSCGPAESARGRQFKLLDIVAWTTALSIALASLRPFAAEVWDTLVILAGIGPSFLAIYGLFVMEHYVVAQLLVIGVLRRSLWPWYAIAAAVCFLVLITVEPWLLWLLVGWEISIDPEAIAYAFIQHTLILGTLLAWRYSGLMPGAPAAS